MKNFFVGLLAMLLLPVWMPLLMIGMLGHIIAEFGKAILESYAE